LLAQMATLIYVVWEQRGYDANANDPVTAARAIYAEVERQEGEND